jgi:hypothetical protein
MFFIIFKFIKNILKKKKKILVKKYMLFTFYLYKVHKFPCNFFNFFCIFLYFIRNCSQFKYITILLTNFNNFFNGSYKLTTAKKMITHNNITKGLIDDGKLKNALVKIESKVLEVGKIHLKYQIKSFLKYMRLNNFNYFNYFIRTSKIFNKGRYSRNRQTYRTGVYWCLYINIIIILSLYIYFYRFSFNFNYLWTLLLLLFLIIVLSKLFKFNILLKFCTTVSFYQISLLKFLYKLCVFTYYVAKFYIKRYLRKYF